MLTAIEKLKENGIDDNNRFEALFQYASVGILLTDAGGVIRLANDFLVQQFGYEDPSELIGRKVELLIPSRFHTHHTSYRVKYAESPSPRPMGIGRDLAGVRKDGTEFPVEVSLSNYDTHEGHFAIAFVNDVSKRKEIENAVVQQKEQLAANNIKIDELNNELEQKVELRTRQLQETLSQLESSRDELTRALSKEKELSDLKSRFVSMASHEFRTPLSTILSSASLLAKYTLSDEQEKRDKHIQRIKSSVSNLTDILNEFLSIGKIEDGKIMARIISFNITELITGVCNEMQAIARHGQKIVYAHSGETDVLLDPSLLKNVLINLLSNAIKFSDENTLISVACSSARKEITLSIKDNGIGIAKADQEHLFERFFRGANASNIQGTGLGLHIVGKYIELMNGHIDFISELEKGTEFIITFSPV